MDVDAKSIVIIRDYVDSMYRDFSSYWKRNEKKWKNELGENFEEMVKVLKEKGHIKEKINYRCLYR